MVTKMVTNTRPRAAIERNEMARAADFPNTNQHMSGQNKTGRDGRQQISSAVLSTTQPPLRGRKRAKQPLRGYVSNARGLICLAVVFVCNEFSRAQ